MKQRQARKLLKYLKKHPTEAQSLFLRAIVEQRKVRIANIPTRYGKTFSMMSRLFGIDPAVKNADPLDSVLCVSFDENENAIKWKQIYENDMLASKEEFERRLYGKFITEENDK